MHIFSQVASVLLAALVFSSVAIAALTNSTAQALTKRHDWEECKTIKITGRDTVIPEELPPRITDRLTCNAAPTTKYEDVHCGNVFEVLREFCSARTSLDVGTISPGANIYKHEDYITDWRNTFHLTYMLKDHIDDFKVSVEKDEHCWIEEDRPWMEVVGNVYDQCMTALWGTWTGCNNKGRGGSITAGCNKYSLSVVE